MGKSISNISTVATERTNITGTLDPILEVQPKDGTELVIRNGVERGEQARGIPVYADLQDSNGDPLPLDTKVAIEFERPADDSPTVISEPLENIRSYRSLDIKDQQDADYVDRVKHILKGRGVLVEDTDRLYISVESSVEIDWANSRLQFDENAVTER